MKAYYEDSAVTIYHGDCREMLPELTVEAIVTDPPYGSGHESVAGDERFPSDVLPRGESCIAFGSARNHVIDLGSFTIAPNRVMVWVPAFNLSKASSGGILFRWTPIYCWNPISVPSGEWPVSDVFTNHDGPVTSINKPVSLMRLLLRLTKGLIVDPFMGSGTTLRAAKDLGRKAIGIEIEEKYCEIAARRMEQEVLPLETTYEPQPEQELALA